MRAAFLDVASISVYKKSCMDVSCLAVDNIPQHIYLEEMRVFLSCSSCYKQFFILRKTSN